MSNRKMLNLSHGMHLTKQHKLDYIIQKGPLDENLDKSLDDLRQFILFNGIPSNSDGMSESRIYIWLILLNAPAIRTDVYLDLVRQGASPAYSKIRNDTFRTLATDPLFRRRVTENSLTRVLNAVAWKLTDAYEARINGWLSPPTLSQAGDFSPPSSTAHAPSSQSQNQRTQPPHQQQQQQQQQPSVHQQHLTAALERHSNSGIPPSLGGTTAADTTSDTDHLSTTGAPAEQVGYVQGMNVLSAPFLYAARSEAEAFVAFDHFIVRECPGYVRGSMEGVHRGLALVDQILALLDPKLSAHLLSKGLKAEIYAFASVLTMCACTPPLPELLTLWDFLLAFGPHLNLVCIVAQLVIMRDRLLSSNNPYQLMRPFPPLNAQLIRQYTFANTHRIPDALYEKMVNHAK